jgi:hypothetical protein
MAMHQGRQSPSQSRLPRLSSAAKAARALCLPAEDMVPERQFPLSNRPDTQPNCDAHLKAKPVKIRTPCQPQNALSVFHRPSPTARSTHATENMQLTCRAVDWKEECCSCHPEGQHNMQARVQQRLKVTNLATANAGSAAPEIAAKTETLRLNSFPHLHFHITQVANNEI